MEHLEHAPADVARRRAEDHRSPCRAGPMVLMQPYEGTSSIEAFINRFEDLRFIHQWTDVES